MKRINEAADQRVATVAIGRFLAGEKSTNTMREVTIRTPDSAAPVTAISIPNPPKNAPHHQRTAATIVAQHCAVAMAPKERRISGEFIVDSRG
jgi:hypothetical protein